MFARRIPDTEACVGKPIGRVPSEAHCARSSPERLLPLRVGFVALIQPQSSNWCIQQGLPKFIPIALGRCQPLSLASAIYRRLDTILTPIGAVSGSRRTWQIRGKASKCLDTDSYGRYTAMASEEHNFVILV